MMNRIYFISIILLFCVNFSFASDMGKGIIFKDRNRQFIYVEDFYNLYRETLSNKSLNLSANIFYLQLALEAAEKNLFMHPVKSMAYVRTDWSNKPYNEEQHKKYKELMKMRISLLLTKNFLRLGSRFDKQNIFWFNVEYANTLRKAFNTAQNCYQKAKIYWDKTKKYVNICYKLGKHGVDGKKGIDCIGPEMDKMEDEVFKIYHQSSKFYKEDMKKYFYKQNDYPNYPEYNFDKVISDRLKSLDRKRKELSDLEKRFTDVKQY